MNLSKALALAAPVLLFFSTAHANPACVKKKPIDFAELRIGVGASDVNSFTQAGFTEVNCSTISGFTLNNAQNLCTAFSNYPNEAKTLFQQTYGVTTDSVCAAFQRYETETSSP